MKLDQIVRQVKNETWYLESGEYDRVFKKGYLWKIIRVSTEGDSIGVKSLLDDSLVALGCPVGYFEEL